MKLTVYFRWEWSPYSCRDCLHVYCWRTARVSLRKILQTALVGLTMR